MSVYVDLANNTWKGKMWGHMIADTLEELHELADKIGLKRKWLQDKGKHMPHYDVTRSKRELAIRAGAIEINRDKMGEFIKNFKATGSIQ